MRSFTLFAALLLAAPLAAQGPADTSVVRDPRVFDSLMAEVRTGDRTIGVEARYFGANNFTGAPLPGYEADRAFLRKEAVAALARVERRLRRRHLGLLVYDGYRPVRATEAMVAWATRVGRKVELVDGGYIASRSRHNLGLAVDLTLRDLRTGRPLEMGTPFDTFDPAAHTANATGLAARNRRLLVEAMEAEGFTNYDQEWWHFSFPVPDEVRFDVPVR
jgi:D-alanyl-D-alanine dipeptidase